LIHANWKCKGENDQRAIKDLLAKTTLKEKKMSRKEERERIK